MSNSEVNTVTPPPPQETAPAPVEAVVEERVSMLKELNISNGQIRKNFQVMSSYLYNLTRSDSKTDEEFQVKYDVYEELLHANQRGGRYGQFGVLAGLITYCLKGNSIPIKLTSGFLYGFCLQLFLYIHDGNTRIQHFYTLGSYVGVVSKLPWAVNQLDMGYQYNTSQELKRFLVMMKQRDELLDQGKKAKSDNELIEQMFTESMSEQEAQEIFQNNHLQNDYFEKNRHKYTKLSEDDSNPMHILSPTQSTDDLLRLKYFDSFLTRYVYHSFSRYFRKLGFFFGLNEE